MNKELERLEYLPGKFLVAVLGDITEEEVDAIVNAANTRLQHGGGVAGAIVRKGGRIIQEESNKIAPIPTGSAGITTGGNLPAKWVIHAVGPIWGGGGSGEADLLRSAVRSALLIAHERKMKKISMPAISTGIFGYPLDEAVRIIVRTAKTFYDMNPDTSLEEIRFCNILEETAQRFAEELRKLKEEKQKK